MIRLLADHNVLQQTHLIWDVFSSADWLYFGIEGLATFADYGLTAQASDRLIWDTCQLENLLLVTGNRNAQGIDALTNVIAEKNSANCLPVLTISRPQFVANYTYREDCAYRIGDILLRIDQIRGAGRLFLP